MMGIFRYDERSRREVLALMGTSQRRRAHAACVEATVRTSNAPSLRRRVARAIGTRSR